MPRKKSAAKKAREASKKEATVASSTVENEAKHATETKKNVQIEENSDDDSMASSSSEDEDDFGELITEEVEEGINKVLNAIRNNETDKLLDPNNKFFEDPENAVEKMEKDKKHKPIYLKDYHRMNILSGSVGEDEEEHETVDGKQSFVSQQKEERAQLLNEINNAFDDEKEDEDEGEDDFLTKKVPTKMREEKVHLPDPTRNEEDFLDAFVNSQAWIPQKGDKVISLDNEDDEEFDNAVETFENAYNFRYEDPNAAEIVSYARTQATLRRSDTGSRRRKRDEEKRLKENAKQEKENAIQKKKVKKANKLTDVLEQLKKEYGAEIDEKTVNKITKALLNNDYEEKDWDNVIAELFNEEFYNPIEKPTWDDDLMNDGMYDEEEGEENGEEVDDQEVEEGESEESQTKKSKKEKKKDVKKEKRKLAEMVDKAIEQNKVAIIDEAENETRGRSLAKNEGEVKFRYREVSPESFGLTTRDIFAADDADLNDFISLKKFAPYRPKELRAKDKRKVTKAKRIRDWKKKVFKNDNGPVISGGLNEDEIAIPVEKKQKKHKKHGHHKK
ncbi:hypothetical protein KAFR_0A08440 [Kazachstania africana CBS 2517]|uniref:Kri1-like C-terminal domain-containing protein n=1 Tax=Kazachstania africana (strain ATCC 22294 / BCRC 22015 / CBS 2517 / CECT 1963 / NBRC 1671 / NRRL Y-8276) TaxID=1071382 RepID=H2APH8_KAZAF|nr:hypothetical protein KAFR_0A08440 [Kazachstania africana CBS 2517]CCF56278.1 hypothetical protein KAFR_0A08440 [Kazachstania africana CBS 2517]